MIADTLAFREARRGDLEALIAMLADDDLGAAREDGSSPPNARYTEAFAAIESDPNNELIVAEYAGEPVGMLQLTFIPYLSRLGSRRCLVESVRVRKDCRGRGFGRALLQRAIARATEKNCKMVQLTSDKTRGEALRLYRSLGFTASHEGFKLELRGADSKPIGR